MVTSQIIYPVNIVILHSHAKFSEGNYIYLMNQAIAAYVPSLKICWVDLNRPYLGWSSIIDLIGIHIPTRIQRISIGWMTMRHKSHVAWSWHNPTMTSSRRWSVSGWHQTLCFAHVHVAQNVNIHKCTHIVYIYIFRIIYIIYIYNYIYIRCIHTHAYIYISIIDISCSPQWVSFYPIVTHIKSYLRSCFPFTVRLVPSNFSRTEMIHAAPIGRWL